jgi:hypothetical protein
LPQAINRSIIAIIGPISAGAWGAISGVADAQRAHVAEIIALVALRDHGGVNPLFLGRGDDLVVDVGDVAGIDEAVLAISGGG